jgi:spoIIIJ-associated protein
LTQAVEKTGKTIDEAVKNALTELCADMEDVEIEVVEEPVKGIFGLMSRPAKVRVTVKPNPEDIAFKFLNKIINIMGIDVNITTQLKGDDMYIDLEGPSLGLLIGKRGQTLDALQYLVSLAVNKNTDKFIRIMLDGAGYRKRREKTLEMLADRLAKKVKISGKSVILEPMPPHERRVIHTFLQQDPKIRTHSEGDEPFRKIIISLR